MIRLNFLPFKNQQRQVKVYRRLCTETEEKKDDSYYHSFRSDNGKFIKYEVKFQATPGYEEYQFAASDHISLTSQSLYSLLLHSLDETTFLIKRKTVSNKKIHLILDHHSRGKKTVWIEPYFMKSRSVWGLLFDYSFVVDEQNGSMKKFKLDREILIASGTLNDKGNSNVDFYLFKHNHYKSFITKYLASINRVLDEQMDAEFLSFPSKQLSSKIYLFGNNNTSNSSYLGLSRNPPLSPVSDDSKYYFLYRKADRDIAVSLLKGLKGQTNPTTFPGMEKLFRIPFGNDRISGAAVESFNDEIIAEQIEAIKSLGNNVIPIIITNSKKDEEDERLYFWLKHKFTNARIPCQVVTKELVANEYTLKYSLSNIGLQIFAKAGGKPWKMKSASNEYLIIGIGQSYNLEQTEEGNKIEKNITYSVLTDSSGLFKDIQVLGEGMADENYFNQLISNISNIILNTAYKKISIHVPFRMSKDKILDKIVERIGSDIELSVLVINDKNDFFGFDYDNNGLVPFESTYIKIARDEFLIWFEGLQYNNPKINKRFGNPLLIKFWYSNRPDQFESESYKESLLQDCINLSGANWRGFKAKQLPVSVFYCQRIAEFIGKFKQYDLAHIEINNFKPWFL